MNIQLPYKWIKEFGEITLSPEEFAELMPIRGPQVEKWWHDKNIDDIIFDIEITPNRIDTASVIGIAREAAAITKSNFTVPSLTLDFPTEDKKTVSISIKDYERCRRFHAIVIDNIQVKESPDWLKKRLETLGKNSINNLVDISNYVLLEYGYPTHIFDYEKIQNQEIIIRRAKKGESFTTLDNETKKLTDEDLVIADSQKPISLAGVKGGQNSGVSNNTKTIVLEAANFEPYAIRKTARRHDLHTDAASLFEKGLSPYSPQVAIQRVAQLVLELAGGEIVSTLKDEKKEDYHINTIHFNCSIIKRLLGIDISQEEVIDILTRLEFDCRKVNAQELEVTVPHFRTEDVSEDYDLVEEIARLYGYENIPSIMPDGTVPTVASDTTLEWEDTVKDILAGSGLTESFSRSIVGDPELEVVGLSPDEVLEIQNPYTEDFKYMRKELTSTMIMTAKSNEDYVEKLALFELNMVYLPESNKDLPIEQSQLSIMINGNSSEEVFLEAKGQFEHLLQSVGMDLHSVTYNHQNYQYFNSGSSAEIVIDKKAIGSIGVVGEFIGLKKQTSILEINFSLLLEKILQTNKSYKGIPKYPGVKRDFSFLFDSSTTWEDLYNAVVKIDSLIVDVDLVDVYTGKGIPKDKKSITFNILLQSPEKTLSDEEIEDVTSQIVSTISHKLSGELRSQ